MGGVAQAKLGERKVTGSTGQTAAERRRLSREIASEIKAARKDEEGERLLESLPDVDDSVPYMFDTG